MTTVQDITTYLERFAPLSTAAEWDNVGLLLGDAQVPVERLLTCLTVTPEVVAEAVDKQVQLIVSHHPVLFRGAKKLSTHTSEGRLLLPLLRHGIAVYSPHTAFDNCAGGINAWIADQLQLERLQPLRPAEGPWRCKVVVFVPDSDLAKVSDAAFAAGAGIIGEYEQCSFRIPGTGTFFGREGTQPTVGTKGHREQVQELRLEMVVPEANVAAVIRAIRQAHSYEEPAYDIYPLKPEKQGGEGRIGELPQPLPLIHLARNVKKVLNAEVVQIVGDKEKPVRKVALACGAAGEFLSDAARQNADVFLTGEVRFHDALAAQARGVALILPGHYASERPAVETLAVHLQQVFPAIHAFPSQSEQDPLMLVTAES